MSEIETTQAKIDEHNGITQIILEGVFILGTESEYGYTRAGLPQIVCARMMQVLKDRGYEPQIINVNQLKDGTNC